MQPESFARWPPGARRKPAYFIIRPRAGRDVGARVRLVVTLRAGEEDAWRRTLLRTVRDNQRRALFVANARGQVAGYGRVVCVAADPQAAAAAPAGWYLLGLAAGQAWRRRWIGEELTRARMAWVAERSPRVYYFTGRENPGLTVAP
jgi:ribosomal protein S18 acetylase RimI-like enzyme